MDKLFEKLPYDDLDGIKFAHLLAGAIGIGLAFFVAYYFTLYNATNEEIKKLTKKKEATQRTLKLYRTTVAKEDKVAKNLAMVNGQFESFKSQMPNQAEIPGLIRRMAQFGKNRNIKMIGLTLGEGKVEKFYKEIPLTIQMHGELWVTLDFIEYMQNLLRLVSFDGLMLTGQEVQIAGVGDKPATIGSLNTMLTVKTYSFIEGAENQKAAKKAPPKKNNKKTNKKGH